ncbi:MAG: glycosyltransferase family 2 protein [Candidatus Baldrarchaeia archaeon]
MEEIDVAVMTYNSERFLDECLTSIENSIPVRKLIIVDHYSQDNTLEIAKKHGAEIHKENIGLGFARQLAIKLVGTKIFMFVDSDVILPRGNWFEKMYDMLKPENRIGAVVGSIPTRNVSLKFKQKYDAWWWGKLPSFQKKVGLMCLATLFWKPAVEKIRIPKKLNAREDKWIELHLRRNGWTFKMIEINGIHYFDHEISKGSWSGAGERKLYGLKHLPYVMIRKTLSAPLKAIPPAIFLRDWRIIFWNTTYWFDYLRGFLNPEKYWNVKRKPYKRKK